jgi:hypothetical protein
MRNGFGVPTSMLLLVEVASRRTTIVVSVTLTCVVLYLLSLFPLFC